MSPLLPTPLLILAGAAGFALALPRIGRSTSDARLLAEVFAIVALTCLGFAAAWAPRTGRRPWPGRAGPPSPASSHQPRQPRGAPRRGASWGVAAIGGG